MSERNRGVGKFGLFSAKNYIRYNESAGISRFSPYKLFYKVQVFVLEKQEKSLVAQDLAHAGELAEHLYSLGKCCCP